ncbi:MAG: rod shape-determining protein RodA [Lentimicrobiaceae bacterium]|nr:rod shape-determining protein RodA [Lentimicrobiaceae bacterium]
MIKDRSIIKQIDKTIVYLYLALVLIGWFNIYASAYNSDHFSIFDISQVYGKQLLWIGGAIVIAFVILLLDHKVFNSFAILIYALSILMLILVLLTGKTISGSKSWFQIGSFALQPSELSKFCTNLALAHLLSSPNFSVKNTKHKLLALFIILLPTAFILLQNDTGSALVYSAFIIVLYRKGLPSRYIIMGLVAIFLSIMALLFDQYIIIAAIAAITLILFLFVFKLKRNTILPLLAAFIVSAGIVLSVDFVFDNVLEPHQKTRINVLLGKELDLYGAGYNVNQSKIAIGSGGFFGKGFLKGTQTKFDFVPEQSTDFIFCTIGEEWGFVGSIIVLAMFLGLIIRIIQVAERQRSEFSLLYGYGVAAILLFHVAINIGMTLGLLPVIGIPLPFFSYGGSSLWSFTILLFIFAKLDSSRLKLF